MSSSTSLVTESRLSSDEGRERRAYNIVRYWRWAHAGLSMVTVVTCGTAFVCQSYVNAFFSPNCLLNSFWTLQKGPEGILLIESSLSKWGSESTCSFTQYSFASGTVAAFILGWFFLLFRPSEEAFFQRKATTASRLVLPGILACLVFFVTCLVSAIMYQTGVQVWCSSLTRESNGLNSCSDIGKYHIKGQLSLHFYPFIATAQAMTWIGVLCWLVHLVVVCLRFFKHSDFPNYFYEVPPSLLNEPRTTVATMQGTKLLLHSHSAPQQQWSKRTSLESDQLTSDYSLHRSSVSSDVSSGLASTRHRTLSFPNSRKLKETYEDLEGVKNERTPVKVALVDYGATAVIKPAGQTTSEF